MDDEGSKPTHSDTTLSLNKAVSADSADRNEVSIELNRIEICHFCFCAGKRVNRFPRRDYGMRKKALVLKGA